MARVPYQPYSEVAPSGSEVSIATPPDAFGMGVAKAEQGLGQGLEQAGDRLFNRAVAFQKLANDTEAEQANLKLMDVTGDIHAKYDSLQGEERYRAYPKYKQDILDAQSNIEGSLSNDDARRMFKSRSLQTVGHLIFNGAGAAATGLRQYS